MEAVTEGERRVRDERTFLMPEMHVGSPTNALPTRSGTKPDRLCLPRHRGRPLLLRVDLGEPRIQV